MAENLNNRNQNEVPYQSRDPLPHDLKIINAIHTQIHNKIYIVDLPEFEEIDGSDPVKKEKRKRLNAYIIETHEILNKCFNDAVETLYVIANTNYQLSLNEPDPSKKEDLEKSILELRIMMEILSSLIHKNGRLKFRNFYEKNGEKKEDTLISGIRVNGNYYGILLNVVKDPIYTTTGDTETFHIPRIKMTIMDQDKISTLSERSNFRFDLDSSSRDKTEPYERRIILDINYPGQPYGIKYENINQHLTHHFLIQEDIDFHQFMHIAKLFKSTLSKKEFSSYNIPGSQTTIE